MHMLVPVDMRDPRTPGQCLLKLRSDFFFQIGEADFSPNYCCDQLEWMMVQKAARVGETWDFFVRAYGAAFSQIEMKPGIEPGIIVQDIDRRFERPAVNHQARRRYDTLSMRLSDSLVDPFGEPQVIGGNDKLPFLLRHFLFIFGPSNSPPNLGGEF